MRETGKISVHRQARETMNPYYSNIAGVDAVQNNALFAAIVS